MLEILPHCHFETWRQNISKLYFQKWLVIFAILENNFIRKFLRIRYLRAKIDHFMSMRDRNCQKGLILAIINIKKSRFEILNTVYLENAWCLIDTILHQSIVMQDNSVGVLFKGLLAELPAILHSFSPVQQVIT